jgi:hypothetical protein
VERSAVPCPQENAGMLVPSAPTKDHDASPLCHLDRSSEGTKWRDLRCPAPKRMPARSFPQPPLRAITASPLCHLDRSSEGAQWRDLRFFRLATTTCP